MKQHAARLKEIAKELMAMYPDGEVEDSGDSSEEECCETEKDSFMGMTGRKPEEEDVPEKVSTSESNASEAKSKKMKMIVSKMAMKMGKKNYA